MNYAKYFFYIQHWKIQTEAKNTDQLQTNFRDFFPKVLQTESKNTDRIDNTAYGTHLQLLIICLLQLNF